MLILMKWKWSADIVDKEEKTYFMTPGRILNGRWLIEGIILQHHKTLLNDCYLRCVCH